MNQWVETKINSRTNWKGQRNSTHKWKEFLDGDMTVTYVKPSEIGGGG